MYGVAGGGSEALSLSLLISLNGVGAAQSARQLPCPSNVDRVSRTHIEASQGFVATVLLFCCNKGITNVAIGRY